MTSAASTPTDRSSGSTAVAGGPAAAPVPPSEDAARLERVLFEI